MGFEAQPNLQGVIPLNPGQGVSDISASTQLIAVVSPNQQPSPGADTIYARWYEQNGMEIISVRDLEDRLNNDSTNQALKIHYDFFSNVSKNIQDIIEEQVFTWPGQNIGGNPLDAFPVSVSAPLQADTDLNSLVSENATIGHNRILENSNLFQIPVPLLSKISVTNLSAINRIQKASVSQISPNEISSTKNALSQISLSQISTAKVSESQASSSQISLSEIVSESQASSSQISLSEIGSFQISLIQESSTKGGIAEVNLDKKSLRKIGFSEIGVAKIASFQVGEIQYGSTQINPSQISIDNLPSYLNPTEISLPSSITLQQLFSSNNPNLQNTTVPTWTEFLQSPTPFNLKIEIQDLPTGQLAEATITGYDTNNRPNSGTLTLDTNTFTPLAGTSIGLTNTDSLLNIQANGTIHKSDKVTITPLTNDSSIVTIDLTQVTPTTQATLYFNLLGFGARTSTVT